MGTRADFYVGRGASAEWLGSVALDGYEWADDSGCPLMVASSEEEFRAAVRAVSANRKDFTRPEMGWPWPWDSSYLTDYVYAWIDGKTHFWPSPDPSGALDEDDEPVMVDRRADFPNMADRKNVQLFGPQSGLFVLGGGGQ